MAKEATYFHEELYTSKFFELEMSFIKTFLMHACLIWMLWLDNKMSSNFKELVFYVLVNAEKLDNHQWMIHHDQIDKNYMKIKFKFITNKLAMFITFRYIQYIVSDKYSYCLRLLTDDNTY